jgi:hypothetical protein
MNRDNAVDYSSAVHPVYDGMHAARTQAVNTSLRPAWRPVGAIATAVRPTSTVLMVLMVCSAGRFC